MKYKNVLTTCIYCGTGCGLYLEVLDGAAGQPPRVVGTLPAKGHPVSDGRLCVKGWNAHAFIHHPDRLTTPLIRERKGGELRPASWDEALNLVAGRLNRVKAEYGPDAIGFLASAKGTNEENYLLQKLARSAVGTNNIDHCARLCHAPTVVGLAAAFGSGAMTNSIPEFQDSRCLLITGSNTTEGHPLIATWVMRAQKRGAKVIVVDPRKTQIARLADLYLCQRPGTDVAWLNGMMHVIIAEDLYDKAFVESRTEGFAELKAAVAEYTPERVEAITGIPAGDLVAAARIYAQSGRSAILYAMGITQHTTGVDNVLSCANLTMLTGNIGRPGTGVNPLRGQNNVQGACDMGGLPNVYSGYQAVTVDASYAKFKEAWGSAAPQRVGLTVTEMVNAAHDGALKALYIMGENPMVSDPDLNHVRAALKRCEFLAVQDIFPTETVEYADVVLPGVSFAEKEGTFTATDRRIQRLYQAIEPLGEARQDWQIVAELAKRMQAAEGKGPEAPFGGWDYASPAEIMAEIAALTPSYGGVSYERLERESTLQWPIPTAGHPGTPYLHKDRFSRGVGRFTPVAFKEPAELPDDAYPLTLTTGRIMFHYHTGSMTRRSEKLDQEVPEGYVEISPEDAGRLGLGQSARVRVISRRGEIETRAWITRRVPPGVVFIPFHFAEAAANVLTNPAVDPVAKIPEYKVAAVRIEKVA